MRSIVLLFTIIFTTYTYANAQITVSNTTFPKAGDTLRTSSIANVKGYMIEKSGVGKTWDFSQLKATTVDEALILAAKDGSKSSDFPKATLVEKRTSGETYIVANGKTYETVGFVGPDPTGLGVSTSTKINPAQINRRAPMNFLDLNNTNSALSVSTPLTALPDSLFGQIGQLAALVDSFRVKFTATRTDLVDGYGTIKVPTGSFEVLREKRLQYSNTKLEAHTKLFKTWTDITSFFPVGQLPAQIKNFVGTDTTFTYSFFSNTHKEIIAVATMDNLDNAKVNNITYKNIKKFTPTIDLANFDNRPDVRAYPNPATDEVNLEMTNLISGAYTLKIYNLLGAVIWQETHSVTGSKTIKVDVTRLRKGSYLYSVSNANGKILSTKRLLIMKA
jgi:hypothetical protein